MWSGRNLLAWGVVALIICLVVIAVASFLPIAGPALAAVADVIRPFAIAAIIIGAVWWLLNVLGVLPR